MKDINNFIRSMVRIDYQEEHGGYGHYPFHLMEESHDGKLTIAALVLEGSVLKYYLTFKKHLISTPKRIYMSLDFPSGGDIESDFVAIFSFEDGEYGIRALPYNRQTGERLEEIKSSKHLDMILDQMKSIVTATK